MTRFARLCSVGRNLAVPQLRLLLVGVLWIAAGLPCHAGLVEVVAKSKPSVAVVGSYNSVQNPRFGFRGTGFVVGDGNLLITNGHVLPEHDTGDQKSSLMIQVVSETGSLQMRPASVVALDATHDLALLRFEGSPLPALQLANASEIHEGLSIAFIGFPLGGVLGFAPVTHHGIVSSITAVAIPTPNSQQLDAKTVHRLREGSFDIYQLDATAYPGNSGGPVLDIETGNVIGVINMVLVKSTKESALTQPTGISYAIPARFIDDLLQRR